MKDLTPIYLKAIKLLPRYKFSCTAIAHAEEAEPGNEYFFTGDACRLYCKTMGISQLTGCVRIEKAAGGNVWSEEGRFFRILLLCMMAACWRDMLPLMEKK